MEIPEIIVTTVKSILAPYGNAANVTAKGLEGLLAATPPAEAEDTYLTKKEAAAMLRCTPQTIWLRMRNGDLTYYNLSHNTTLISKRSVLRYLESHKKSPTG